MTEFRKLDDKFSYGESLTDNELVVLINYYSELERALDICYKKEYHLLYIDVNNNLRKLNDYILARQRKD